MTLFWFACFLSATVAYTMCITTAVCVLAERGEPRYVTGMAALWFGAFLVPLMAQTISFMEGVM